MEQAPDVLVMLRPPHNSRLWKFKDWKHTTDLGIHRQVQTGTCPLCPTYTLVPLGHTCIHVLLSVMSKEGRSSFVTLKRLLVYIHFVFVSMYCSRRGLLTPLPCVVFLLYIKQHLRIWVCKSIPVALMLTLEQVISFATREVLLNHHH